MPKERVSKEVLKWNLRAAKNGNGQAAVKVSSRDSDIFSWSSIHTRRSYLPMKSFYIVCRAILTQNSKIACTLQVARAYLKALPSDLPLDPDKAVKYFQLAVNSSQEPDAHFGLAQVCLRS